MRVFRWIAFAGVLVAIGLNVLAYRQAHTMTSFTVGGPRTAGPEHLSLAERAAVLLSGVAVPRPAIDETPADVGLAYESMRFASGHGPDLEAWNVPVERPKGIVVLFHGYASSKSSLVPQARLLHELGWQTMLVDFYGSGGSTGASTTLGVQEAADVVAALEVARAQSVAPIVLYGISMGGAAVLRAVAVDGARADALIVEGTYDTLLGTIRNRFRSMDVPAWPAAELLLYWGGRQQGFDAFAHNPVAYAERVEVPTLVLNGADDPRVTLVDAHRLHAALGAHGELCVIPGVGHVTMAAAAPEPWRAAVGEFLAARSRAPEHVPGEGAGMASVLQ
jgi:alpha-beta hydrolase superfamily lysophospholipase